jgi:hypothetical protein
MLDLFTILTSGGIVLFQKSQASSHNAPTYLIDRVITDVFLQERSSQKEYATDGYTIKWAFANELGLIFVAAYQKILELTWVDELLVTVKRMFVKWYAETLKTGDTTAIINELSGVECRFGTWFDGKVQSYEGAKVLDIQLQTLTDQAGPSTISVRELGQPLLAIQSDTEPPVTSDDNTRSPADSPVLAPVTLKTPVNARLKKGKGKRGKNSPYQSRFFRYLSS